MRAMGKRQGAGRPPSRRKLRVWAAVWGLVTVGNAATVVEAYVDRTGVDRWSGMAVGIVLGVVSTVLAIHYAGRSTRLPDGAVLRPVIPLNPSRGDAEGPRGRS